jgi:hypothetical protein
VRVAYGLSRRGYRAWPMAQYLGSTGSLPVIFGSLPKIIFAQAAAEYEAVASAPDISLPWWI